MYRVDLYGRVRRAVYVEGISIRAAAKRFGIHRETVKKMLAYSLPPGYRRKGPAPRPKLGPYLTVIDAILERDREMPVKQRHTAQRIFDRLRGEHGYTGGYTAVKDYVRERVFRSREVFVPLAHPPGHCQSDFGEALAVIGGVLQKVHFSAFDLPHSDAGFVKAYPAETSEAFCDSHNAAFQFFGGVPVSMLYDNTTLAVARICGDGKRERTRMFSELVSHYLFLDRFGRPGKGNDKGSVEGLVGYVRRNFFVPVPHADSFERLNAKLEEDCRERFGRRVWGEKETIGERLGRDRAAFLPLPACQYDACQKRSTRASSLSLVRYANNDYSVPVRFAHREVLVKASVWEIVVSCGAEVIACHPRSYGREEAIFDPRHYLELLEKKTGALDSAAPLTGWELAEEFAELRRQMEARLGKMGTREYVQVLRLLETFSMEQVHAGVRQALRLGTAGFDAVKHLVLCRIERRPPRLNLAIYPYLPSAKVETTRARSYLALLEGSPS
jgi:transposase